MTTTVFMLGVFTTLALLMLKGRMIGFTAQKPEDYAGQGQQFDLRRHLSGPILCEGVIFGPTGRVTSRFVADMEATWDGNAGVMTEEFRYDSGSTQSRRWTLTLGNDGTVRAEAPDVVGSGTGKLVGSALKLAYRIRLPEESGGYVLDATDWMYLTANDTIINRSQFRKYGVKVAELVATLRRKEVV